MNSECSVKLHIKNVQPIIDLQKGVMRQIKKLNIRQWKTDHTIWKKKIDVNNTYISKKILKWIHEQKEFHKITLSNLSYGVITIYSVKKINNMYTLLTIMKICMMFKLFGSTIPLITIILTPFEKNFNDDKSILSYDNVNSGVSYGDKIIIWREEEVFKVLFHELIHHYQLDSIADQLTFPSDWKKIRSRNVNEVTLKESITETLATIFQIAYFSIDTKSNINKLVHDEVLHSLIQVSKILKYYEFDNVEAFLGKSSKYLEEKSHVLGYYIIKSIFLYNITTLDSSKSLIVSSKEQLTDIFKELMKINSSWKEYVNKLMTKECDEGLRMTITSELYKKTIYEKS